MRPDGVEEIFLPGERSGRKAEEKMLQKTGIEVPQPVYEELLELGHALRPEPVKEEASWQKFSITEVRSTPSDPSC